MSEGEPEPDPKKTSSDDLEITLKAIAEAVVTIGTEGRIERVNPAAELILSADAKELIGHSLDEVFVLSTDPEGQPLPNPYDEVCRTALPVGADHGIALQHRNGHKRRISFHLAPMLDYEGQVRGGVLVFSDITERVRLEQEIQRVQKMDSLAVLSSGIAHDFNNFLTAILGNLSLARQNLDEEHPIYRSLVSAERSAKRARNLTDRLFSFSRGITPLKSLLSIKPLLEDTLRLILGSTSTEFDLQAGENLWLVEADEGQLSQVFNNLLINACEAMDESGLVTIDVSNRHMAWEKDFHMQNGPYLEIRIRDQGRGIAPENLPRVFEPYYTTKDEGTGLGLSSTYSIVKHHGGHIEVTSDVGRGTSFCIYLPAKPGTRMPVENDLKPRLRRGSGRILVLDDEPTIQQIITDMLGHLGYETICCKHGEAACERLRNCQEKGETIDAFIIDLTVGSGTGGVRALDQLRELAPETPAIVCSGYSHSKEIVNHEQYGFVGCIVKPFNIEQISWTLQKVFEPA